MSKTKFAAAKELIDEKKYDEARGILKTIDHPTAREWEGKLNKLDPPKVAIESPPVKQFVYDPVEPQLGMKRFFRTIWGLLTLGSLGWICYGIYASTMAYSEVAKTQTTQAGKGGAAIGASIGLTGFLCIGVPLFCLFAILYWRNGVAIRQEQEHAEMMTALQNR